MDVWLPAQLRRPLQVSGSIRLVTPLGQAAVVDALPSARPSLERPVRLWPEENVVAVLGAKIAVLGAKIAVLGAKIAVLGAKIDAQGAKIDSQGARLEAQITEIKAEIKAQTSRIDVLQRVIWRVIWPLIILLAAPIFGLPYKALTG